jgi:hypothetical protein
MSSEQQDITAVRGELLNLKGLREHIVAELAKLDKPPEGGYVPIVDARTGYPPYARFSPELDEVWRQDLQARIVDIDERIARAVAFIEEGIAAKLAAQEHIFHAPGPGEGYTYCGLEIRALQEPDRCFSWASDGVDTWNSNDLTCSICRRIDTMGTAAGWGARLGRMGASGGTRTRPGARREGSNTMNGAFLHAPPHQRENEPMRSMIGSSAAACVALGEDERYAERRLRLAPCVTKYRAGAPGPKDDIRPGTCLRCGFQGPHANAGECIAALRDRIAVLEFKVRGKSI